MELKNVEKALDIYSRLVAGEEVSTAVNSDLYENYAGNAEVYDVLDAMVKRSNLRLYEYGNAIYLSAGTGNKVFGFTNDDLKKEIGLRLNKELFLAYYMIFETVLLFYESSSDVSVREYVKVQDVIEAVSAGLLGVLKSAQNQVMSEIEETSFKTIALLWDELPMMVQNEDMSSLKAARGSKIGFTKLVFNFLKTQNLFSESGGKYYATNRFRAMVQNYYEDEQSRLFEIVRGGADHAAYSSDSGQ